MKKLKDAIKAEKKEDEFSPPAPPMWADQAIYAIANYTGDNPILKAFRRKYDKGDWTPTENQCLQIHRVIHQDNGAKRDSLGRPVRRYADMVEDRKLPSSLDDPGDI